MTFIFKHALTQDVAYNSLLSKREEDVHGFVAKTLEEIYPKRVEEYCEILSFHFFRSENWQRAYIYSRQAGLKALRHSNYEGAQGYFETALSALEKLPPSMGRIEQEIDLRFNIRSALFPLIRHDEWNAHMSDAEVLAKEIEDEISLSMALAWLSFYQWRQGRNKEAIRLCEKGLRLAESTGDFSAQISSTFSLGILLFRIGKFERQANSHREVAQRLTGTSAFERHGFSGVPSVLARSFLACGLAELGKFEEAENWDLEAIEISEQVKNTLSTTFNYTWLAFVYLRPGKLDSAIEMSMKCQHLIREANVQAAFSFNIKVLGQAHLLKGNIDQALQTLEESVNFGRKLYASGIPGEHPMVGLAEAYLLNGQLQKAVEKAEEALRISMETGALGCKAWIPYVMAKIQLKLGTEKLNSAVDLYQQAIDQAGELKMRPLLAHCHLGLGQLYIENRRIQEAQQEVKTAIDLYNSMNMSFWLPKAEASLSQVHRNLTES